MFPAFSEAPPGPHALPRNGPPPHSIHYLPPVARPPEGAMPAGTFQSLHTRNSGQGGAGRGCRSRVLLHPNSVPTAPILSGSPPQSRVRTGRESGEGGCFPEEGKRGAVAEMWAIGAEADPGSF